MRRWPLRRRRAPTPWSSGATTSRSTVWPPSSTASSARLLDGRGFARIGALDAGRYSDEDLTLLYWGIGLHLGEPWAQNKHGHVLGDVTDQGKTIDDPTVRGNELGGIALDYHTDGSDLVGLLCLRTARVGGLSCVANAVAIHNQLVRESPQLAAALYDPLPYDTRGEQPEGAAAFYSVPGFTEHAGRLFVRFIPQYILASQRHADAPRLSPTAREAIAAGSELANDPDFNVYMDLQPGEMQFINNYHVLHGRTAYEDDCPTGYKRHLKRLWLATYALKDRPAYFQALGRRSHWEARALGQHAAAGAAGRGHAVAAPAPQPQPQPQPGSGFFDRENNRRRLLISIVPSTKLGRQRAHAQNADGRDGRVDQASVEGPSRRPPSTTERDVGGVEGRATSSASVKLERHGAPRALLPAQLASARPSGMPTTTAQPPDAAPAEPRRADPLVLSPPAKPRGTNTSTGPGQQRSSSCPSSSVQPDVMERRGLGVADRVVGALGVGRQLHQPRLGLRRPGAHGEAVAAHRRDGDDHAGPQRRRHCGVPRARQRRMVCLGVHVVPHVVSPVVHHSRQGNLRDQRHRARGAAAPGPARPARRRTPAARASATAAPAWWGASSATAVPGRPSH